MNIFEFREYIEENLEKEKFLKSIQERIISSNIEVEEDYRVPEKRIHIVAENVYKQMIENTYQKVLKNLNKKEKTSREAWINKINSLEILDEMERSLYE
ncbi:hypothetical protein LI064_15060 [Clostridium perfringens]|uniref:hypothetical protein n=1 Tax=Clostridium perfringens TaxID=1502 RepID=UPI0022470215|nr:hypothetical protein [Clostridium perfringens]MCX0355832.1 hypothetical protein [Clostridium perfringens]